MRRRLGVDPAACGPGHGSVEATDFGPRGPPIESKPPIATRVVGGRYRLGDRIGAGGMGEVFDAHHLVTGRRVAVKRIAAGILGTVPHLEQRILDEAAACGALRHPGIVEILDAGWTDAGDLFLVFERLEGQTLDVAFRQRRLAPRDLVRVAVRLLDALHAVHEAGWVHRDVKPANIFLAWGAGQRLEVKLIDFGIAVRAASTVHDDAPVMGTLEYMSPEQALADPLDGRADLWSVGAVLFRGLTGEVPWPARTPSERARSLSAVPPCPAERRPDLPASLARVVRRCLHGRPNLRYATAEALAAALMAVEERALLGLRPPSAVPSSRRQSELQEAAMAV